MELRAGYFYPASKTMRDIYKNGGACYEIEHARFFCKDWQSWMTFGYFQRNGFSIDQHDSTTVRIYPLSMGVKYYFPLVEDCHFYLGAGGSYTWIYLHDRSPHVNRRGHGHGHGFGVVWKSGILYQFKGRYFLDFFADYYYTRASGEHFYLPVQSTPRNIGGFRVGIGIGLNYDCPRFFGLDKKESSQEF